MKKFLASSIVILFVFNIFGESTIAFAQQITDAPLTRTELIDPQNIRIPQEPYPSIPLTSPQELSTPPLSATPQENDEQNADSIQKTLEILDPASVDPGSRDQKSGDDRQLTEKDFQEHEGRGDEDSSRAEESKEEDMKLDLDDSLQTQSSSLPPEAPPPTKPNIEQNPLTFLKGLYGEYKTNLFTGSASYQYPVWVPQGRGSVTPSLSLTYESTNTKIDSVIGQGWTLSGGAIYRSTRKGVDKLYTENDFSFELFGQAGELIVIDAAQGTYAAQVEGDFSDFQFQNNQWVMKDRSGTVYTFGAQAATRQSDPNDGTRVYKWMLEKIEDRNGNIATFTYFQDDGQIYPASIRYSGHTSDANDPGLYEVKFNHALRPKPLTSALTGFKVTTNYSIDRIDLLAHTQNPPELIRSYELQSSYNSNSGSSASRSTALKLYSIVITNGALSLPPLQFQYYEAAENLPGQTAGLLKKIVFPTGGSQELTYKKSTAYRTDQQAISNNKLPFQIDTVHTSTVKTADNDPGVTTTYHYSGGHYYFDQLDAYKKEYVGFHQVSVTDPVGNIQKLFFHQSEFAVDNMQSVLAGEYDDHISKKGRVYREEQYDDAGNLYTVSIQKWVKTALPDDNPSKERFFVTLGREVQASYDGDAIAKATAQEHTYDQYGNLLQSIDYGEVALNGNAGDFTDLLEDKVTTEFEYAQNLAAHLLGEVKRQTVKDFQGTLIGEAKTYYDDLPHGNIEKGNPTKYEALVDTQGGYITTQTSYNAYGLPIVYTDGRNFQTTFSYDAYHLFPISITNAKNQVTTYTYNYLFGLVGEFTDPNGAKTINIYDDLGRVIETKVSDPQNPGQQQTISTVSYDTTSSPQNITVITYGAASSGSANNALQIQTRTYIDGLGRIIQTKTEAEGQDRFVVQNTAYDERGLVKKEFLPVFTTGIGFEAINPTATGTSYTYDALGRPLTATNPLGTSTTSYNDWVKVVVDANGKRKDFRFNARGELVEVKEYLDNLPYSTFYTYDANGNLVQITDAKGNIRHFEYDFLGRKLSQEDWHTANDTTFGTWSFGYDNNGNLVSQTDAKGQTVVMTYDELDRPLTEDFVQLPGIETSYVYDQGAYGIGRLASVSTPAITKAYSYDLLGHITQEQRSLEGQTYTTSYHHDTAGHLLTVIYPDGFIIDYSYNNGGQLETVLQTLAQTSQAIVNNIDHSPAGQVERIDYANGVVTEYTYDPQKLYQLTHTVTAHGTTYIQDLSYNFDAVGNLLTLTDASNHNGAKTAAYSYDDLYRLTSATITNAANGENYTHTYTYDILGNILSRTDAGTYEYAGNDPGSSNGTLAQPHAVTDVNGVSYSYDENGNLVSDGSWTHEWDYRNRLVGSSGGVLQGGGQQGGGDGSGSGSDGGGDGGSGGGDDGGDDGGDGSGGGDDSSGGGDDGSGGSQSTPQTITYAYDEGYERVKKTNQTTGAQTLYINNYFEIEDEDGAGSAQAVEVKHIYAGDLKVATIKPVSGGGGLGDGSGDGSGGDGSESGDGSGSGSGSGSESGSGDGDGSGSGEGSESGSGSGDGEGGSEAGENNGNTDSGIGTLTTTPSDLIYHHTDHLSGNNVDTNDQGEIVEVVDYYPYGNVRLEETAANYENKYKYTGKELDDDTGLYYYGARYYNASIGRFISVDPWEGDLTDPQSFNKYSYVMNNPLLLKDKNGRYPVKSEVTGMEWDTYSPVYLARLYERVAGGDLPNSDILGVLKDYGHQNVRYAYTEKVGWLDMEHFFAAASTAYVTGYQDAIDLGGAVEIAQQAVLEIQQRTGQTINSSFAASAYSFEDLTSNTVGAYFGAYYLPEKEKTGMNVSQALDEYFQKLGVASKEDALKNHSKVTIGGYTEWELPEGYTAEHDHPKSNQSATSKEDLDLIVKFDSLKGHN